jgi:hypothetical protein
VVSIPYRRHAPSLSRPQAALAMARDHAQDLCDNGRHLTGRGIVDQFQLRSGRPAEPFTTWPRSLESITCVRLAANPDHQ